MMTPLVTTRHQIPQEDRMELPISMPEEKTDDEDDQESDNEELVIPKTAHRTPDGAEESLAVNHLPTNAQTLVYEWFTERDVLWSQKSYHK
jgi:hypothetical protein